MSQQGLTVVLLCGELTFPEAVLILMGYGAAMKPGSLFLSWCFMSPLFFLLLFTPSPCSSLREHPSLLHSSLLLSPLHWLIFLIKKTLLIKKKVLLILESEIGRGREKHWFPPICASTRDQPLKLLVTGWGSNQQSHTSLGNKQKSFKRWNFNLVCQSLKVFSKSLICYTSDNHRTVKKK